MMRAAAREGARLAGAWLLIVAAAFLAIRALPSDPAVILANAQGVAASPALVAEYHAAWGLDRPLAEQFAGWLMKFLSGDWGRSLSSGRPVFDEFVTRTPWSLAIGCGGLALAALTGFGLGFRGALRPGGLADRLTQALAVAGQSLPGFAVGLVLLWWLAVEWRLLRPLSGGVAERLLLPVLLVALFSLGSVGRVARAAFAEAAAAVWMRTALAKGLSPAVALWRHGRRHAALTVLAAITPELAWVIGGTAVAEVVFGIPGLSDAVIDAVGTRDYMVLQAYMALVALWIVGTYEAARWARRRLDPRLG